jgi:hypothetical protein
MMIEPFKHGDVESIQIGDVLEWTKGGTAAGRLCLPPIQRSIVWTNAQVLNYWDSLLRGYPAGLMIVHRSRQHKAGEISTVRTMEGRTQGANVKDFHLFDGQQRMTAILLGHQAGQLNACVKLWVDFGVEPSEDSGLLFQLRISSTGQPFGYQSQSPNQKEALGKRREKIDNWVEAKGQRIFDSSEAFAEVKGTQLIEAVCAVPFHEVISLLFDKGFSPDGLAQVVNKFKQQYPAVLPGKVESFVSALAGALQMHITFQLIGQKVVEDEKEYIRYFGRLGQGGTSLSNDELTYSIIKHQYPEVHDRMNEIMNGRAGRVASEVNLVLAALRVAKVLSPWKEPNEGKIVGRPYPGFVSQLKQLPEVEKEFQRMLPVAQGGLLRKLLEAIRDRLDYKTTNTGGLPVMLLARLPHQLIDVLLLMATQLKQGESEVAEPNMLPLFVLHWLLFVSDYDKAATLVFKKYRESSCVGGNLHSIQVLIHGFETEGIARIMPTKKQLREIREEIEKGDHYLRPWAKRFAKLDSDSARKSGDGLRVLASNRELIKRTLMWLQRDYLTEKFRNFDPTSSRDEDLPIDLDHLIPDSKFGFNWKAEGLRPDFADADGNFYDQRKPIGNSLGNFHWLDAAVNRSRGAGKLVVVEGDLVQAKEPWDHLIEAPRWNEKDTASFQRLIDLRTLDIYEKLLDDGGLESIILSSSQAHSSEA